MSQDTRPDLDRTGTAGVGASDETAASTAVQDDTVVRFSVWSRVQHVSMIVLFTLLLVTGLPQKWPFLAGSQWIVDAMGGIFAVRWLHRAVGVVFTVLTGAHLVVAVGGVLRRRFAPTMMIERKDFTDAVQQLRYYLGRTDKAPAFGRYDYRQKFEYWGLVFGSMVMVGTGLVLLYPILLSQLLPAQLIPAAKVMHSNEALLAFLIVIFWHMYGAHLNPDVFPFDKSIFTGRIAKERLHHEHRLEYEEKFGKH